MEGGRERERVSWCFEPSQLPGITSGLIGGREGEKNRERESFLYGGSFINFSFLFYSNKIRL